jgi:hypothetical protein
MVWYQKMQEARNSTALPISFLYNYFDKNLKTHQKFTGEKLEITICKDKNTRPIRTK